MTSEVARVKPTNSPSWIAESSTENTMPVSVTAKRSAVVEQVAPGERDETVDASS